MLALTLTHNEAFESGPVHVSCAHTHTHEQTHRHTHLQFYKGLLTKTKISGAVCECASIVFVCVCVRAYACAGMFACA